ncbi:hypothetical protein C4K03_0822 [Pseudomonas synxantha]|uniref:Phage protein n=1 Tax=Pseudomonas synxantha TaxID=47883 RepID=A0A3G7U0V2_9PSED|nr:hypothetical protein [Pseudomonas synxantha]AZE52995.1 hypothetical protein C4K03_0822 [Pseudomonas synxantha]
MFDKVNILLGSNVRNAPVESTSFLRAIINGKVFEAPIVGGRYDGDETDWIRRSWGRGPLADGTTTHSLIFITCLPELRNDEKYELSTIGVPASIGFTNLFPAEDGDEFDYLVEVKSGWLQLNHDFSTYWVTGSFAFSVDVIQADGNILHFDVTGGELRIGPTTSTR